MENKIRDIVRNTERIKKLEGIYESIVSVQGVLLQDVKNIYTSLDKFENLFNSAKFNRNEINNSYDQVCIDILIE